MAAFLYLLASQKLANGCVVAIGAFCESIFVWDGC
jgi:hypothetical protein